MKRSKKLLADDKRFDRVHRLLDPWMHRLSLSEWTVHLAFTDKIESDEDAAAEVSSGYPYLHMTIELHRKEMDKQTDRELTHLLVHEVMHIVLFGPIHQFVKNAGFRCDAYDRLYETAVDLAARFLTMPHVNEK